jgi:hypothetical protein
MGSQGRAVDSSISPLASDEPSPLAHRVDQKMVTIRNKEERFDQNQTCSTYNNNFGFFLIVLEVGLVVPNRKRDRVPK